MKQLALIGKPNSGKSSLFNKLTGLNQKIGNYSGVTVEKKSGISEGVKIIDLPGLKSLWVDSLDEQISLREILDYSVTESPLLFVANGVQLADSLLLFSEIADLQLPMIMVINFKDELKKSQLVLDKEKIKNHLGCEVVLMNSKNGDGIDELKKLIKEDRAQVPHTFRRSQFEQLSDSGFENFYLQTIKDHQNKFTDDEYQLLEEDFTQRQVLVSKITNDVLKEDPTKLDILIGSKKADKILLHPIWGMFIFLAVMLVVFQSVFTLSGIPMDWIDQLFAWLSEKSKANITTPWLSSLVSDGILAGLGGVLIFIPQIAILFIMLGILENSGYLSRISYISDNFLQNFGLSGKSVIPLMSSWACAIPAIMSTRMIEDEKERMAVILASPLMTCSARLPVYTILIAVMFPDNGDSFINAKGLMLFALYLLGVVATLVVAWFINKRSTFISASTWTLELPMYRMPNWKNVFYNAYSKTKSFVVSAGKIIFMISIVLWLLASYSPKSESFIDSQYEIYKENSKTDQQVAKRESIALEYSYAGYLGKLIEPAIRPLGYDWKIGIALITSFAAREVFVGTLSTIYSIGSEDESSIIERLRNETNLKTGEKRYNMATSISLLLFYVFAMQCMSTLAIVRKETGKWKYAVYQFVGMLILAYGSALLAYNLF